MLFVLCAAIFLEGVDVAMLNAALPAIRSDPGLSTGELQWVMSAYVLGCGGFMSLGGRAADLFGRRTVLPASLTVFLLFSGLGGLAGEGRALILVRFVTGVAAAFVAPAGHSLAAPPTRSAPRARTAFRAGPDAEGATARASATVPRRRPDGLRDGAGPGGDAGRPRQRGPGCAHDRAAAMY